jgi:hypothetical protein
MVLVSDKKYWLAFGGTLAFIACFIMFLAIPNPIVKAVFKPEAPKSVFPQQVMGMKLVSLITGEEAQKSVAGLHGLEIKLKEAYIGTYQNAKGSSAIIWVSESNNVAEAKKLFEVMDQKMPANSFFTDYKRVTYQGIDLRYVYWPKMNMHDFYYLIGTKNYWIAITVDQDTKAFLDEVLQKFPPK